MIARLFVSILAWIAFFAVMATASLALFLLWIWLA
jgi:hypothetical protein